MYRVDKRIHRHKRARRRVIFILAALLLIGIVYFLLRLQIEPEQNVRNSPSLSTSYRPNATTKVQIDKPLFKLELPDGWKERPPEYGVIPQAQYIFQSTKDPAQILALYIDAVPAAMAINKAIVVSTQGNGLSYETVSENCTTFTDSATADQREKIASAKWQNIHFLCDIGNTNRGVVGTQSTEGINRVTVTGQSKGQHTLFVRYTDNSLIQDYSTLYVILASIHFK